MFTLTIDTANAAFEGYDFGPELARILRNVADQVDGMGHARIKTQSIFDYNGNRVGGYKHEEV